MPRITGVTLRRALVMATLFVSQAVLADVRLDATHVIDSASDYADHSTIALTMTVSNTGSESLSDIRFATQDYATFAASQSPLFSLNSLAAGATQAVQMSVQTPMASSYLAGGYPLALVATARDANGNTINVFVTSTTEVQQ